MYMVCVYIYLSLSLSLYIYIYIHLYDIISRGVHGQGQAPGRPGPQGHHAPGLRLPLSGLPIDFFYFFNSLLFE